MDLDRPHRSTSINNSTTTTSELFICFTSRLSSSSMKISSKSILSPGHTREPCPQISSSLSRRLRSNGSMKGGQASPMFPTNGKRRGSGFENPEPSSPKVTCIGQVRVKTKKQSKKLRACRSKRRDNGIESTTSIRLLRNSSSQQQECKRWVHLPVTICEALRGFGAEFNCFLPCRSSSCIASCQRDNKEEKTGGSASARWVVVSGEEEEEEDDDDDNERRENGEMMMIMRSSQRRHVFEDIDINDYCNKDLCVDDEEEENEQEDESKVSICIPPKNALLLMRCRSDPVKMAALANKFWETPLPQDEQEEEEADNGNESEETKVENFVEEIEHQEVSEVSEKFVSCIATDEQEIHEAEAEAETEAESVFVSDETEAIEGKSLEECSKEDSIIQCQEQEHEIEESAVKEETLPHAQVSFDLDKLWVEENVPENEQENENVSVEAEEEETKETQGRSEMGEPDPDESKGNKSQQNLLPDCLLLMMCEPKLSMEVSKETWVCSTDFIRCVPENKKKKKLSQEVKQKDGGDQPTKTRISSIDTNPPAAPPVLLQPRRSSCSFPVAPPMAVAAAAKGACGGSMVTMIEKKLVGGKVYEPFVLARCKSEPRRSSARLAPDTCFWKNRKLEPAVVGVGAAGVGF